MQISVTDAKAQLTALLHLAEAGEQVVLTRHGHPVARLVPMVAAINRRARLAALDVLRQQARSKVPIGPGAVRSQDFLNDADGLPE